MRGAAPLAGALLLELAFCSALARFGALDRHGFPLIFVALFLCAGGAYVAAARWFPECGRPEWNRLIFWAAAIALRLAVFPMPPGDDFWRYLWEGRIQTHGFNPYVLSPDAPELAAFRDAVWVRINHRDWAAIYPPGAQLVFATLASASESQWVFKLLFGAADLAGCAALLRLTGGDFARTALYAWNPLVVCSFAGAGHYDSLMILALLLATLALERAQPARTCAWLGAAIALKVVPGFLLPVWLFHFGRRAWWVLLALAIPLLVTIPFGGPAIVQEPLENFAHVTRFNDLVWWLVEKTVWPNPWGRNERYAVVLAAAVLAISIALRHDWRRAMLWVLGAVLVLSPALHPWYVTWILPFACWRKSWPWIALSLSVAVALLVWEAGPFWKAWEIAWPLRIAIAAPPLAVLLANRYHRLRHEPADP
jgi:alpha-1,6-mannosyltransferase